MDRDDRVSLLESVLLSILLYAAYGYSLVRYNGSEGTLFVVYGTLVAATVLFGVLFLPRFSLASSSLRPEAVLPRLAYGLRQRGLRVEESSEYLTVRLGSTAAVRVHARASRDGSRIRYQLYATPAGWGTLVTLIVIIWTAPASVGATLYVARRARRFAAHIALPLLGSVEGTAPGGEDETRGLLISGLSEGHRLAAEAYEALRSSYTDSLALVGLVGALVWGSVFAVLVLNPFRLPLPAGWPEDMGFGIVAGIVTSAALYLALRRTSRPRMLACRSWSNRLQMALSRETSRQPPEPPEQCSVELLLEASRQIPTWLESRRRAGLSADQATDWIVFVLSMAGLYLIVYGIAAAVASQLVEALVGLGVGIGCSAGAYVLWHRWTRARDAVLARTREEWRRRMDALQSRIDGFLERL